MYGFSVVAIVDELLVIWFWSKIVCIGEEATYVQRHGNCTYWCRTLILSTTKVMYTGLIRSLILSDTYICMVFM